MLVSTKPRKLSCKEDDLMKALLALKNVPEGCACSFKQAKSVFLHQTVINTSTYTIIPLTEWSVGEKNPEILQNLCGKYPCQISQYSLSDSVLLFIVHFALLIC